ncbi:TRAP transporter small permease subunit [Paracoccus sp. Z330]|uniref:TRAP transporter small permease protein n=1 Tax=Paracoccus onchidii TaxID=3017813 RepID=A0ABT4ZGS0_9RHOB|nr:TRAP transporter small permease subunit [Paracoccus onchidii]MDB6178459.1 TRAP transporter small permease subunit [Paracoccus onchidii]
MLIAQNARGPLGPLVALIDSAIRLVSAVVLLVTFCAIFLPTLANAILRYSTSASISWSVEIVELTFPWFIMAGAALAAQHSQHIGVELLSSMLTGRLRLWLELVVQTIVILCCGAVVYVFLGFGIFEGGMQFAAGNVQFTSLGVPQSYSYLALLFGYGALGVTAVTTVIRLLAGAEIQHSSNSM